MCCFAVLLTVLKGNKSCCQTAEISALDHCMNVSHTEENHKVGDIQFTIFSITERQHELVAYLCMLVNGEAVLDVRR